MNTNSISSDVSKRAGWSIFLGLLTAAVGVVMIFYPVATATASTLFFGWALIVAAFAQIVLAFSAPTAGKFILTVLVGILYGIAGVCLVAAPGLGVVTLTAVLGAMLIGESIVETIVAFSLPAEAGRGGLLVNALLSLALGIMILSQWPVSSVWAIGTIVGVAVFWNGVTRAVISGKIKHVAHTFSAAGA